MLRINILNTSIYQLKFWITKHQCFIIHKNRHLSRKQVKYVHNNQSIFCIQYILHLKNLRRHNEYDNLQYRLQIFQGRCSKQRLLYHHNKHNQLNSYEWYSKRDKHSVYQRCSWNCIQIKAYLYFKACTETARRPIPVRKRSSCPYTKVNWYAEVPQKQHLIYLQITAFNR